MDRDWFEFEFIEVSSFKRQIKKLCSSEEEEAYIKNFVSTNRSKGDPIIGSSGIRIIRVPLSSKGTRGGARVIYYFTDNTDSFILFLMIYSKGDKENLTSDDEDVLVKTKDKVLKERGF